MIMHLMYWKENLTLGDLIRVQELLYTNQDWSGITGLLTMFSYIHYA